MKQSPQIFLSNLIWRFLERTGAQLVTFVVAVVLSRILSPEEYGIIALITVFINILNVFVDSGLGTALIQKKDADAVDFSTVFYANVVFCLVLYALFFAFAPFLAFFYKNAGLTPVIRVLGITILISGVKNIQQAYVSKTLQFKKFFFATLIGTISAAFIGISLAYQGYGVWALVVQQISNLFIDTVILWVTVRWKPNLVFSFNRLKTLLSFGWKMLVSALLDTTYTNLRQLIIGKKYSPQELAFYDKGNLFPSAVVSNLNSSINSVLLPVMASEQDDKIRIKQMTRRAIKTSTYCIAPLVMGLSACASPIVKVLLTEKWLPCVPFMRIFCVTYMFYPIHTANLNAITAMGRSDLFLKLEVIKKVMGLSVLLSTMWFGVMVMAYSLLLTSVLGQIINSWPNKKLLNYGYLEQLKDILPAVLLAVGMGGAVWILNLLPLQNWKLLLVQIPVGIALYVAGSMLFRLESFSYLKNVMQEKALQRWKKHV